MYSLSQLFTRHNIFLCQPVTPKDYTQTSASIPFLLLLWQASPEVLHSLACQCPSKFFPANLGMSVLMLEFILPHANSPSSFCHPRTHEKGSINGVKICVVTARINYSFYQNEANGDYMWNTVSYVMDTQWFCLRPTLLHQKQRRMSFFQPQPRLALTGFGETAYWIIGFGFGALTWKRWTSRDRSIPTMLLTFHVYLNIWNHSVTILSHSENTATVCSFALSSLISTKSAGISGLGPSLVYRCL